MTHVCIYIDGFNLYHALLRSRIRGSNGWTYTRSLIE